MVVETTNQCSDYLKHQAREAKKACAEIPEDRRESLRREILTRANIMGVANPKALTVTLTSLI